MTFEVAWAEWVEMVGNLTPAELREMADRAESHDLHYVNSHARTLAVVARHFADLKERCNGMMTEPNPVNWCEEHGWNGWLDEDVCLWVRAGRNEGVHNTPCRIVEMLLVPLADQVGEPG